MKIGKNHTKVFMKMGKSHTKVFMKMGKSHTKVFMKMGKNHKKVLLFPCYLQKICQYLAVYYFFLPRSCMYFSPT